MEVQKPKKAWVAPKCTYYCDWVDLNDSHRPEVLAKHRRRERKMLRHMLAFLIFLILQGVEIFWNGRGDVVAGENPWWRLSSRRSKRWAMRFWNAESMVVDTA